MKAKSMISAVPLLCVMGYCYSQTEMPRESPYAKIIQRIGVTDVEITYHRPAVNGRKIWGGLVPYGNVWRAGANDNTTVSFSTDVKINGQEIKKGIYGFHTIPAEKEWTLIFSNKSDAWGSFSYKKEEDALRLPVVPEAAPHQEQLVYGFEQIHGGGGIAFLHWEKVKVPFRIEAAISELIASQVGEQVRKTWLACYNYGLYCLQQKRFDEAIKWADKAVAIENNFSTQSLKMMVLGRTGKTKDAESLLAELVITGNEQQLNQFGYQLLNTGSVDLAIKVFQHNADKYPQSWNVYDSLADGYERKGDRKKAAQFYQEALKRTDEDVQKERISKVLERLKG